MNHRLFKEMVNDISKCLVVILHFSLSLESRAVLLGIRKGEERKHLPRILKTANLFPLGLYPSYNNILKRYPWFLMERFLLFSHVLAIQ